MRTHKRAMRRVCAQVEQLLGAQQPRPCGAMGAMAVLSRDELLDRAGTEARAGSPSAEGEGADAKVPRLRALLGSAVRTLNDEQRQLSGFRAVLCDAQADAQGARNAAARTEQQLAAANEQVAALTARVEELEATGEAQREESAAKIADLEEKIAQMEEEEKKRIAIQAALAAAEPEPPVSAAPPICVSSPVVAPEPEDESFNAASGGFEL